MKDKSIKQPWPRSAKVTVWVLVVLVAIVLPLAYILIPDPPVVYIPDVIHTEEQDPSDIEDIPMETPALVPTEEDVPIIMPDLEDIEKNDPIYQEFEIS